MIREGLMADLIVLDSDPFAGPPDAILRARVVATYFGGRKVGV
jgi:predicted amidohydrolase YtcJ